MKGFGKFYTRHRANHIKRVRRDLEVAFSSNGEVGPKEKAITVMRMATESHMLKKPKYSYYIYLEYLLKLAVDGESYDSIIKIVNS